MFWERYHKSFTVWVKIIAYYAIIIFRHLVKVAIFAASNFFSLFGIAVFNVHTSHIIVLFDYDYKDTTFFRIYKFFLTFFIFAV